MIALECLAAGALGQLSVFARLVGGRSLSEDVLLRGLICLSFAKVVGDADAGISAGISSNVTPNIGAGGELTIVGAVLAVGVRANEELWRRCVDGTVATRGNFQGGSLVQLVV